MRELTEKELDAVSGAGDVADAAGTGAAIGGLLGIAYAGAMGATGTAVAGSAAIGAAALGGFFAIYQTGHAAGTWLNNNTPIQSWIASGIDALTGGGGGGSRFPVYENLSD